MEYQDDYKIKEEVESIKFLVRKIKEALILFKNKFWLILIVSILGAVVGFLKVYSFKPIFSAKVKFIMKDNGGGASFLNSLGSLGSLIGGASGSASAPDRTLAILGSERIVGRSLLKPIVIDSKKELAINHFIRISGLNDKWKEDTILNNIKFSYGDNIYELNYSKRKAYKIITNMFIGEKSIILERKVDKKSGVFELSINSSNEVFAIEFCKLLYNELEQFTYNQMLSSSGKNIEILNNKIDSIKSELNFVQNALARNTDRTLGLLMQEDKVDQKKLMMKEQMLTLMYGEAQKNLETFKFVNESINKGLEILEYPLSPIVPERKSKLKYSLMGFLLFGLVCFILLFSHKWLKEQLAI